MTKLTIVYLTYNFAVVCQLSSCVDEQYYVGKELV